MNNIIAIIMILGFIGMMFIISDQLKDNNKIIIKYCSDNNFTIDKNDFYNIRCFDSNNIEIYLDYNQSFKTGRITNIVGYQKEFVN